MLWCLFIVNSPFCSLIILIKMFFCLLLGVNCFLGTSEFLFTVMGCQWWMTLEFGDLIS